MRPRPPSSTLFPYTTLFRSGRRELRSADVAHHQGMTGHHEPGLVGPGPISDEQRHVLGSMSRRMQNLDGDVPKLEHVPDRKSTRLNSSHQITSYAVFCLKKK